jgi:hypothetical protein
MNQTPPIITFRTSVPTTASPNDAYDVLADLSTHLAWAGERSPDKNFRLLTMEAASTPATVGDRFSSRGASGNAMTFVDTSVVVHADRGERFGFDTKSTLERKHRANWQAHFTHRYTITPVGEGATLDYVSEVWPENYRPFWLHPLMRPMTRVLVRRAMRKNMENLASMAEKAGERQREGNER